MDIKVYLHRTKKKNFEICDCFSVVLDFDKLPEEKKEDVNFINTAFSNDCQKMARTRDVVKKYGTGYISFMRPQYEGDEKENGNEKIYFDNKEMLFKLRENKPEEKPKAKRSTKVKTITQEENNEERSV